MLPADREKSPSSGEPEGAHLPSPMLRQLIQRRALKLYGDICRIVPPPLAVRACQDPNWTLENFRWSKPVGGVCNVPDFLEFRRQPAYGDPLGHAARSIACLGEPLISRARPSCPRPPKGGRCRTVSMTEAMGPCFLRQLHLPPAKAVLGDRLPLRRR